jgi:hypothetical protein
LVKTQTPNFQAISSLRWTRLLWSALSASTVSWGSAKVFSIAQLKIEVRIHMRHNYRAAEAALLILIVLAIAGCRPGAKLPARSSREYGEVVRAFYIGLAALQVGDDVRADSKLAQVTQLVPDEPAGWANWGLLALRQRNFDPASERLERA